MWFISKRDVAEIQTHRAALTNLACRVGNRPTPKCQNRRFTLCFQGKAELAKRKRNRQTTFFLIKQNLRTEALLLTQNSQKVAE